MIKDLGRKRKRVFIGLKELMGNVSPYDTRAAVPNGMLDDPMRPTDVSLIRGNDFGRRYGKLLAVVD